MTYKVEDLIGRITCADCLEVLRDLPAECASLILTDPPYCVSRTHQLGFSNMGRSGMNFGQWDYEFNQREWIGVAAPLLKPGGGFIVFNDWKNLSYLVEELDKNGFVVKDLLRWEKTNPMPRNTNSRYVTDCEYAIWAVKDKGKWTFNKNDNVAYLKPAFRAGVVLNKPRIHPTQKPLELFQKIIQIHSNPNDLILDPFSGSGTTAVACHNLNRRFICVERDPEYHTASVKRLEEAQRQHVLF